MHTQHQSWIGIDVSKATLDVAIGSQGAVVQFTNDRRGFRALFRTIQKTRFDGIVCESTGVYHRGLMEFLGDRDCPFSLVQPLFVHRYRQSGLALAKTDPLDARLLARYGEERHPRVTTPKAVSVRRLTDLLAAHRDHTTIITQTRNRLRDSHQAGSVRKDREAVVVFHQQRRDAIDREISQVIARDPILHERDVRLRSVPGIGLITSATLLAEFPELGTMNRKEIGALAGLAPYNHESGQSRGKSFIRGGRGHVRAVLVFAARSNRAPEPVKRHRQRMKDARQHTSIADVATARWFVVVLNAMMRDELTWEEMDIAKSVI